MAIFLFDDVSIIAKPLKVVWLRAIARPLFCLKGYSGQKTSVKRKR